MKPTILLTAANAITRRDVTDVFDRYGYEVLTASDGAEARALFRENRRIGIIVADVELGGLTLAREARSMRPDVGVVYTSVAPYRVADNAKVSGAPMLRVPYAAQQLVGVIAGLGRRVLADPLAA
jgi:two-component system cell cycle sensor histidine kinase/response regulator CckA